MNPYYSLIDCVFRNQPCTRLFLEHTEREKFKNQIDECIKQDYITAQGQNENGDALYYITSKGKEIID